MPWAGSQFNLLYNWIMDRDTLIKIRADRMMGQEQDIVDGMEQLLLLNGANSPQADIGWAGHKITNLAAGTADTDAVNYGQVVSLGGSAGAGENLLRNAEFRISQRDTTFHDSTAGNFLPMMDGWIQNYRGGTTPGQYLLSTVPASGLFINTGGILNGTFLSTALKWEQITAATGGTIPCITQRLESPRRFSGGHLAGLLYRVTDRAPFPAVRCFFGINFGTGGSAPIEVELTQVRVPTGLPSGTQKWTFHTVTPVPDLSGFTWGSANDEYAYFSIVIADVGVVAPFNAYFSGISLFASDGISLPNAYPARNFPDEIAAVQRFFETSVYAQTKLQDGLPPGYSANPGMLFSANDIAFGVRYAVPKRRVGNAGAADVQLYRTLLTATARMPGFFNGAWSSVSLPTVVEASPFGFMINAKTPGSLTPFSSFMMAYHWTAIDPVFG